MIEYYLFWDLLDWEEKLKILYNNSQNAWCNISKNYIISMFYKNHHCNF